jgi:hypothetical protein
MGTQTAKAPTINPQDYCAVTKSRAGKVYPDFVNAPALKAISRSDAEAHGWTGYVDFIPCRNGHVAPKFCANGSCIDCWRVSKGKPPIHGKASDKKYYKARAEKSATGAPVIMTAPELDAKDRAILAQLAETLDIQATAKACGITVALIAARRAHNKPFDQALTRLESDLGIARWVPPSSTVAWTPEMEETFVTTLINTGNASLARDAAKVTFAQFIQRLEDSPAFAAAYDRARPLAMQAYEEKAQAMALNGNDKLLSLILKAENREKYGDQFKIGMHMTAADKMTDSQLAASLARTFRELFKPCLGLGYKILTPEGTIIQDEKIINAVFAPENFMPVDAEITDVVALPTDGETNDESRDNAPPRLVEGSIRIPDARPENDTAPLAGCEEPSDRAPLRALVHTGAGSPDCSDLL